MMNPEGLKKFLRAVQARFRRRRRWLRLTKLLPPEDRGFSPRLDGDERPAALDRQYEKEKKRYAAGKKEADRAYVEPYPRRPSWALPARPDDAPPSWDDVVRAYEEC